MYLDNIHVQNIARKVPLKSLLKLPEILSFNAVYTESMKITYYFPRYEE